MIPTIFNMSCCLFASAFLQISSIQSRHSITLYKAEGDILLTDKKQNSGKLTSLWDCRENSTITLRRVTGISGSSKFQTNMTKNECNHNLTSVTQSIRPSGKLTCRSFKLEVVTQVTKLWSCLHPSCKGCFTCKSAALKSHPTIEVWSEGYEIKVSPATHT